MNFIQLLGARKLAWGKRSKDGSVRISLPLLFMRRRERTIAIALKIYEHFVMIIRKDDVIGVDETKAFDILICYS